MAGRRFEYLGKDRTSEDVAKRAKGGGDYDSFLSSDVITFKPKEGTSKIRLMPPSWGKEDVEQWGADWSIDIWLHYSVGPDDTAYLCLDKMGKGPCPICEARRDLDGEEADALKPSRRALAYVINRDAEREGPMVWSIPVTLLKEIATRSTNKKTGGILYIDDPDNGHDVEFEREGTQLKTKYTGVDIEKEETDIAPDDKTKDRWLDYITDHPLPEVLVFYEYDYLEKVLFGKKSKRDKEGGDDRSSRRSGRDRSGGEEDDRSSRRSRDDDRASSRRSGRDRAGDDNGEEDAQDEPDRSERRERVRLPSRDKDKEDDQGERGSRRGTRDKDRDEEDDRSSRRGGRDRDAEKDENGGEEDDPSDSAKSALERVRNRRNRGD